MSYILSILNKRSSCTSVSAIHLGPHSTITLDGIVSQACSISGSQLSESLASSAVLNCTRRHTESRLA